MNNNAPSGRIVELDCIRALAVMGIIFMNVLFFSMPSAAYFNPGAFGGMEPLDLIQWSLSFLFIEDKFRGIFAMLFGASMMLMRSPERSISEKVSGGIGAYYRRLFWLLIIGFAHAILLANNDILRLYAICGIFLPLVMRLSPRGQIIAALFLLALHMIPGGYLGWLWMEAYYDVQAGGDAARLAPMEFRFGPHEGAIAAQIERHLGSYGNIISARLANPLGPLITALLALPLTLATMIIGMILFRTGFLTGQWTPARYRKTAVHGFAIGLSGLIPLWLWIWSSDFAAAITGFAVLVWSAPFDLAMAAGWAALFMACIQPPLGSRFIAHIAAVGRMALTNYVMTSVILSVIFFGYGFGLYGQISRSQAFLFALIPMIAMLLWSAAWMARFRYGPLEWLWRSLSRWQRQPFKL